MTATERLQQWATRMGTTPQAITAHTDNVKAQMNLLQQAKNDGATDDELIALAKRTR